MICEEITIAIPTIYVVIGNVGYSKSKKKSEKGVVNKQGYIPYMYLLYQNYSTMF